MRSIGLAVGLLAVAAMPALAAGGWSSYSDKRAGYEMPLPPGFVAHGAPNVDNLQTFDGPDHATLISWGSPLTDDPLALDAKDRMDNEVGDGWTITYEAIGKAEASYSGTKGQRVLYAREISGCKGKMHAGFYLQYRKTHLAAMKPVVEKLVAGLTQQTCS